MNSPRVTLLKLTQKVKNYCVKCTKTNASTYHTKISLLFQFGNHNFNLSPANMTKIPFDHLLTCNFFGDRYKSKNLFIFAVRNLNKTAYTVSYKLTLN